jgi:raffinose/stachyose/melibiose transport system permease protein
MKRTPVIVNFLVYAAAVLGLLLVAFPLYLTVAVAFKSPAESARNFFAPPQGLFLDNFKKVMRDEHFFDYLVNSVMITAVAVVIIAVFVPMVSFSISRNMERKGYYKFIYFYFVIGIFVPFQVLMVPLTQFASKAGMMNRQGLILLYITYSLCQGVFLFAAYFKSIPLEIEEAAEIDGCNVPAVFFRIIYPLVKPMTATIVILNTLWIWNDFLLPLLILNRRALNWTLPLFQYNFKSQYTFDYNLAFASFLFSIVPMLVIYVFLQRHIIEGLTAGSVKS